MLHNGWALLRAAFTAYDWLLPRLLAFTCTVAMAMAWLFLTLLTWMAEGR